MIKKTNKQIEIILLYMDAYFFIKMKNTTTTPTPTPTPTPSPSPTHHIIVI